MSGSFVADSQRSSPYNTAVRGAQEKVQRDKRDENVKRNEGVKSCHF